MTTIAEFTIPAEEFALRETLEHRSDLKFEVDRVVAHETTRVSPFVWVSGEGLDNLTSVLDDDPTVGEIELYSKSDEERFYRLEWTKEAQIIGYMVIEHGATIQHANAANGKWTLRVLFPDRNDVSATADFAKKHGLSLDLRRLYGVEDAHRVHYGLTEGQHNTLVESYEKGYYEIPRNTDAVELANNLDISHQALSERLRRATGSLIENALVVDEDDVQ